MINPNLTSFADELTKTAIPAQLAMMPASALVGAILGGATSDDGQRGRGALIGAGLGAGVGYGGGILGEILMGRTPAGMSLKNKLIHRMDRASGHSFRRQVTDVLQGKANGMAGGTAIGAILGGLRSRQSAQEKTADIAKIVRILKTPIPKTPKLFMKVRSKEVLKAEEHALREKLRDKINENLYKGLKKLRVDKAYQKLEPVLGSKTAPKNIRETFGERQIHEMAHRPFHYLLGKAPIPYVSSAHNILSEAHQKLMGVPPPRAYKMPEAAAEAVQKATSKGKMTGKEKALLAAKLSGSAGVGAAGTAALMSHGENQ